MPSSILNSDDGVISGTSGLKSSGGDDGALAVQSNGTEVAKFKTTELVINDGGANYDFRVEGDTDANLLVVDASTDRVGIGTSSPLNKLHINVDGIALRITRGNSNGYLYHNGTAPGSDYVLQSQTGNINLFCELGSSGVIKFATEGNERARISSSGETQAVSDGLLGIAYGLTSAAGTTRATFVGRHSAIAGSVGTGTDSFIVWSNGNVINTNNSYGQISDIKTKQDIVDAGSQWDDIKNLRVRKFRFKDNPTGFLQIGVVAQELEAVSPGLIDESPDTEKVTRTREVEKTREVEVTPAVLDEDGNVVEPAVMETETYTETEEYTETVDLGTTTKSVKYSVLYMKAVKALQEAMERIETLEAKNDALEARLSALEQA